MSDLNIECPHCGESFQLTAAIAAPIVEAEREKLLAEAGRQLATERATIEAKAKAAAEAALQTRLNASEEAVANSEARAEAARKAEIAALKAKEEAEQAKRDIELEVRRQVEMQRAEVERRAAARAQDEAAAELKAALSALAAKDVKLREAQAAEIEARSLNAKAAEALREIDLTVARRVEEAASQARDKAVRERDEENRLRLAEKDKQLADLRDRLEEAQRKATQGSQQLAGDVLELDLFDTLQQAFPGDRIERIRKGQRGADVLHTVLAPSGAVCGTILWESKRTKAWQEGWLAKLREDQREVRADLAVLASETLPVGLATFAERDGVWITSLPTTVPVAALLRHALIEVANARRAGTLAESTKDQVFGYLTSPQFRQRVTRVIEGYAEMRQDLDREKRATATLWNKREKQLDRILGGLAGLYGDLQGIIGASLPQVEGLALPAPESEVTTALPAPLAGDGTAIIDEVH